MFEFLREFSVRRVMLGCDLWGCDVEPRINLTSLQLDDVWVI